MVWGSREPQIAPACQARTSLSAFLPVNFAHNQRQNSLEAQAFKNDLLSPGLLTFVENNMFAGELEKSREKDDEGLVRRVINRRRG
jgi:hypothetical protein